MQSHPFWVKQGHYGPTSGHQSSRSVHDPAKTRDLDRLSRPHRNQDGLHELVQRRFYLDEMLELLKCSKKIYNFNRFLKRSECLLPAYSRIGSSRISGTSGSSLELIKIIGFTILCT